MTHPPDRSHPLLTLALETSQRHAGVAVLRDVEPIATGVTGSGKRTAAELAPLVRDTLRDAGAQLRDVELIAVTIGPGSFTGLRVGVTTAKTLAYAVGCEVLGVHTLEVLAQQAPAGIASLWAVLDAQRQQLFAAQFERDESGQLRETEPTQIIDADGWLAKLSGDTYVTGPGLQRLARQIPETAHIVPKELWQPQAETVGQLAHAKFTAGHRDDKWKLAPLYFRPSAAEEKWASRPS